VGRFLVRIGTAEQAEIRRLIATAQSNPSALASETPQANAPIRVFV
jgi:hypothetical protein